MEKKKTSTLGSEKVFVRSRHQAKDTAPDDVLLLAFKLCFPLRQSVVYSPELKSLSKSNQLTVVTCETKNFSALFCFVSSANIDLPRFVDGFQKKISSLLKSTGEKLYFIDIVKTHHEQFPAKAFLSAMAHHTFDVRHQGQDITLAYFKLEKEPDEQRFLPLELSDLTDGEESNTDIYLYFKKNDRYIRYIKKGQLVSAEKTQKLKKRGLQEVFIQADQPLAVQTSKAQQYINQQIKEFYRIE